MSHDAARGVQVVISFIEAADMSFKAALSVAVTIGGMMAATAILKSESAENQRLDLSRPVLWTAEPVRVPPPLNFASGDGEDSGRFCVSEIGLRIDCDLINTASSSL
jgi:hypothetical protein